MFSYTKVTMLALLFHLNMKNLEIVVSPINFNLIYQIKICITFILFPTISNFCLPKIFKNANIANIVYYRKTRISSTELCCCAS